MDRYDVAAYVWPSFTGDDLRSRIFWPEGYGEWQTVRQAEKKFDGHNWPRKPRWGYVNEADPYVMEMQIEAAVDHGVNVFIYDWYWYDNRPFLENCLNDGFLKADNCGKMKFYIMWANHDAGYTWDKRCAGRFPDEVIWSGAVDRKRFETACLRVIDRYFTHPCYYRINGCPVFSIYDMHNLIEGLGGLARTAEALAWFREQTMKAGFPGLHIQHVLWGDRLVNLSGVDGGATASTGDVIRMLGFDSATHYQYCHFADIDRPYADVMKDVVKEWHKADLTLDIPYFPHVSIGWDNNPRYVDFRPGVLTDNTPEQFERALRSARDFVDAHPGRPPLITINSWNEWTESSYLQPDDVYGYGYLEAVRRVFREDTTPAADRVAAEDCTWQLVPSTVQKD